MKLLSIGRSKNFIRISRDANLLSLKNPYNVVCKAQVLNFSLIQKPKVKNVPCILSLNLTSKSFTTTNNIMAMFNVQDEEDFQEKVIKSDIPVIVDFHANWCGPCKILGPRLENIISSKADKVHLAKIDIDSVSEVALEYKVSVVPSVIAIKNGKVVDKFVGLQDETRIDAFVRKLIEE